MDPVSLLHQRTRASLLVTISVAPLHVDIRFAKRVALRLLLLSILHSPGLFAECRQSAKSSMRMSHVLVRRTTLSKLLPHASRSRIITDMTIASGYNSNNLGARKRAGHFSRAREAVHPCLYCLHNDLYIQLITYRCTTDTVGPTLDIDIMYQ